MNSIRLALRRAHRDQGGFSVAELIVYIGVMGIILAMAAAFYVGIARSTVQSVDRRASTAEAQNMLDLLATDIRAATNVPTSATSTTWAVLSATPSALTLITYTDAGPSFGVPYQVQFRVDGSGRLVLDQWNPPGGGAVATFPQLTAPTLTRYVGNGLTSTSIFSYKDASGTDIPSAGGMSSSSYANVASVVVSLSVQAPRSSVPVTMTNTISMPNAGVATAYAGAN